MSGWEDSFVPVDSQPIQTSGGWESSFTPLDISQPPTSSASSSTPETMGPLSVPQTEAGYLLNAVNQVPGINLLKEGGAAIRGLGAAATGGNFSDEYDKSRANQEKLMYNEAQQQPTANMIGQVGAGVGSMGILPTVGPTGSMMADALIGSGEGGGYGALSGFGNGSNSDERSVNALHGLSLGASMGGIGGLAAGGVNNLVGAYKGLYPEARLSAAQDALNAGIPVYKNNLSDSKALNYLSTASNEIPSFLGGTSGRVPSQQEAMAEALNKTMGVSSNELSNTNTQQALADAGKTIGDINAQYSLPFDSNMNNNLRALQVQAKQQLNGDNLDLFNKQIASIKADASTNGRQLPGPIYQQTRSGLNQDIMANSYGSTAKYGQLLQSLRNTLDDGFQAQATPEDALALQKARALYQNAKTVEPITDKYPLGDYPMGSLNLRLQNNDAQAPLGRVGQLFKNMTGNSGTAQRELLQKLGAGIGGLAGAGAGLHEMDPDWGDNAMALGGMAIAPGLANRAFNPRVTSGALNGYAPFNRATPQMQKLADFLRMAPSATPLAITVHPSDKNMENQ